MSMQESDKKTVRQLRSLTGMTQFEFAKAVEINPYTYQTKESGKRDWKAKEIKGIATFLKISTSEIEF